MTISWVTDKPTRGTVIVSKNNQFPFLPVFSRSLIKDDGEKLIRRSSFYTTHLATAQNLDPNTKYYFRIYQGLRAIYQGEVKTAGSLSSLAAPTPVYGPA